MSFTILAIAAKVERPLAMDDFTDLLWKTGYVWVWVELGSGKSLKPSVSVKGKKGIF